MAKKELRDDSELLRSLVEKIESWYLYASEDLERLRAHQEFLYVDQWDMDKRSKRTLSGKPTLQSNKLLAIIRSILGEQRKKTPSVEVNDVSLELRAPQQTIDLYNDFAREITARDSVDVILQTVFRQFFEGGWGTARVVLEYEGESFNQIPRIVAITDQQSAFWDPGAEEWDKLDGDYCGVYQRMKLKTFKEQHPDIEAPESVAGNNTNFYLPWSSEEEILLAEIYVKEHFTKTIVKLNDGTELEKGQAKKIIQQIEEAMEENPELALSGFHIPEIVDERIYKDYKIKHYKFIQNHILEQTDYPGKLLPIPYGEGDGTVINGKRVPLPFLTEAIDTQKLYNFVMSEVAYALLRARKETWIATAAMTEGYEEIWRNPDSVQGALPFNFDQVNPNARPERIPPESFPPDLLNLGGYITKDMQELTGRYEEARGQESNAQSGVAIGKRRDASNLPVNVYEDNLARFLKTIFRIVFDLFKNVMQQPNRKILTRGKDGKRDVATLNMQKGYKIDPGTGGIQPNIVNDVTQGSYDIEVKVTGSLDEQRQSAVDFLLRLAAIEPQVAPLVGDFIAENSGLENAQKLMNRLQTLVPPNILAQEKGQPPPPPPPPPPVDPLVQAAQLRLQGQQMETQYRQQELQLKQAQLIMEGQAKNIDVQATMSKARAEIIKSQNAVHEAALDHANTVAEHNGKFIQNVQQAQQRHAAMVEQSKILKQ